MKTVLTIAGFDPSSGAGVTADLMVFAAHGLFGTACITALTVQSTMGVKASYPVDAGVIRSTLDHLVDDLPPTGIKIGMLGTPAIVAVVADYLERHPGVPVVLDPVLRSSSGRELLSAEGVVLMRERLLPLVDWVTPNADELGVLTGERVTTRDEVVSAAHMLQEKNAGLTVLATGGHLQPPDDLLVLPDGEEHWLPGVWIETTSTHGTGCALSSALLSRMVLGDRAASAAVAAKQYVAEALRTAVAVGHGKGPIQHLWPLKSFPRLP
jgi:hydroxymethylpyrimidine/phosphomethylpyrimidine kinase